MRGVGEGERVEQWQPREEQRHLRKRSRGSFIYRRETSSGI
jgi:hypothetical protein